MVSAVKGLIKRVLENTISPIAPVIWRIRPGARLLVLMYHRVLPAGHADAAIEQPGMFVSPATLDMHLSVLRRHFELVHLDDWLRRSQQNQPLPGLACAITFDDGWRDNFDHALPVLLKHRAPATIFLVSGFTGTAREFWPNRLARLLLAEAGAPGSVRFPQRIADLIRPTLGRLHAARAVGSEDIDYAIMSLKQIDEADIRRLISEVAVADGVLKTDSRDVLNEQEVRAMAASGLIRFGSHTQSHYRLRGEIPSEVLQREIVDSQAQVAQSCGRSASLFCYPNGDLTDAAVGIVRRHYIGAVTTKTGWHAAKDDPMRIHRIGVHEDVSNRRAAFLARLSGWL